MAIENARVSDTSCHGACRKCDASVAPANAHIACPSVPFYPQATTPIQQSQKKEEKPAAVKLPWAGTSAAVGSHFGALRAHWAQDVGPVNVVLNGLGVLFATRMMMSLNHSFALEINQSRKRCPCVCHPTTKAHDCVIGSARRGNDGVRAMDRRRKLRTNLLLVVFAGGKR